MTLRGISIGRSAAIAVSGLVVLLGASLVASAAEADTKPPVGTTATTVSSDPLPTVQINGVVWSQIIVGDTVYVGGQFSSARPAGAAAGSQTTSKTNVLAYRLSTGALISSFTAKANGAVRALAASSDGGTIYLGGTFTSVNGNSGYPYVAAVNASTGALVTSFAPKPNAGVYALARNASTVYIGGSFTQIGSTARTRAAAVSTSGALQSWAPSVADGKVAALAVNGSLGRVVLGGNFTKLNGEGSNHRGSGVVDATSGKSNLPWDVGTKVKNSGTNAGITSLTSDGTNVYGTGFVYGSTGNLEGMFSAPWSTGSLRWVEDCHGDTYSSTVLGGAVYIAGHPHYCETIGGFPDGSVGTWHRALSFSTAVTGVVGHNTRPNYPDWFGNPAPSLLHWFPTFNAGTYTGQNQGPWSVASNGTYVVYGGEFTTVNGKAQQGLVRFAVSSVAPNRDGPQVASGDLGLTVTAVGTGRQIAWKAVWDRDNASLTYSVKRNGVTITTRAVSSNFWSRPTVTVTDPSPGSAPKYQVIVTDSFGNSVTGPTKSG